MNKQQKLQLYNEALNAALTDYKDNPWIYQQLKREGNDILHQLSKDKIKEARIFIEFYDGKVTGLNSHKYKDRESPGRGMNFMLRSIEIAVAPKQLIHEYC